MTGNSPIYARLPLPAFGASRNTPLQGTLPARQGETAADRFHPLFSGDPESAPPAEKTEKPPGFIRRLFITLLRILDKLLGREMEHIQRTVEHVGTADRLQLQRVGVNKYEVLDRETGKKLATVQHSENSANEVEMYLGKGGFTAIVTSENGTQYFGLGHSRIEIGEGPNKTVVETHGEPITSNPGKTADSKNKNYTKQQVTPQAMILGAGMATRFEPVSGEHTLRSKPDVFLNGNQTVIQNIATVLARGGFRDLFVNTYFMPASLKQSLGAMDCAEVGFIDEQAPSGTAGGLRKLLQNPGKLGFDPTKPVIIVQGDAVTDVDLGKLMETHEKNNALVTIGCQSVDEKDVDKFGIVVTDKSGADGVSGNIESFQEKPKPEEAKSRLGNTGFYIFSPEAYPLILEVYKELPPETAESELDFAKHIFPKVLEKAKEKGEGRNAFWAQQVDGYWSDIGNPAQYLESVYDVFEGKVNLPVPGDKDTYVEHGTVYWPGAREAAAHEGAHLSGNVVAALPYEQQES